MLVKKPSVRYFTIRHFDIAMYQNVVIVAAAMHSFQDLLQNIPKRGHALHLSLILKDWFKDKFRQRSSTGLRTDNEPFRQSAQIYREASEISEDIRMVLHVLQDFEHCILVWGI